MSKNSCAAAKKQRSCVFANDVTRVDPLSRFHACMKRCLRRSTKGAPFHEQKGAAQQRKSSKAAFFANDMTRANWANQLRTQKTAAGKTCRQQFFMFLIEIRAAYIMPMPPAPPAGIAGVSSLMLATTDSVVSSVLATLVAFCRALLVTFAGSRIPASIIFT